MAAVLFLVAMTAAQEEAGSSRGADIAGDARAMPLTDAVAAEAPASKGSTEPSPATMRGGAAGSTPRVTLPAKSALR